jgi:uncharacterized protein (TIGR03437 family)
VCARLRQAVCLVTFGCVLGRAQVDILTAGGNNERTGANLQEVQLSPDTVSSNTFGKLGTYPVDGQVYAQVLVAGSVAVPNRGLRSVLYICTMHNSVYAFDAAAAPPSGLLWHINLGPSVPSPLLFGSYSDISTEVGILGTGAIDLQRGVLYVVSDSLRSGAPIFQLHALDLATGAERLNGPIDIVASITPSGPGAAGGTLSFDPQQHLQRPGLLLANDSVYIGFGSHGDQSPWHGWLISYDANDLQHQVGIYNTTPTGNGGAFWQSGRGLAADAQSNLYALSGNGDYDGVNNFSQSFLKLAGPTPALTGSFTPPDWKSMSDNDFDLSAGPALISGTKILVGADKLGYLYVLNGDTMTGAGGVPFFPACQSSIFSLSVWSLSDGALVFVQGSHEPLKSYRVGASGFNTSPVATSSYYVNYGRVGMTLSADGMRMASGILWQTSGDYNDGTTPGNLRAFNAADLSELWSSDMNPGRDAMPPVAKFVGPTVANGRVYVPTFGNAVVVYGLLSDLLDASPVISFLGNAASYGPQVLAPGEMIAIFGDNLGPDSPTGMQLDTTGAVATLLGGTRVLFDGIAGPMAFASTGQVNALVPFAVQPGTTQVQVETRGQLSDPVQVQVFASSPGVFSADGSGRGQALAINPDGTLNSPDNPAPAGSIVIVYATGVGELSPAGQDGAVGRDLKRAALPVSAILGNQAAQVLYAGTAAGIVEGVIQVNLLIPGNAPADPALPLVLQAGAQSSPSGITIAVRR